MSSPPDYKLGPIIRPADPALGLPCLRYAQDDLSERVLVRTWPGIADAADEDLMAFWQDEVRKLKALPARALPVTCTLVGSTMRWVGLAPNRRAWRASPSRLVIPIQTAT
jgi:hypothetical protein